MALVDLKTDLKSLKYAEVGTGPLVSKDINDPPVYNSFLNQATSRVDDLVRITKFLASGPGAAFAGKQALLSGGRGALRTLGSALAQVPVSGTGVHFITPIQGRYIDNLGNAQASGLLGFLNSIGIGSDADAAPLVQGGASDIGLGPNSVESKLETKGSTLDLPNREFKRKGLADINDPERSLDQNAPDSAYIAPAVDPLFDERVEIESRVVRRDSELQPGEQTPYLDSIDSQVNLYNIRRIPNQSVPGSTTDLRNSSGISTTSLIDQTNTEDIVPFEIEVITPERVQGRYEQNAFLNFRVFLESLDDNFTGEWAATRYIGRAENFYSYQGFERSINFTFKMAAFSKGELLPLYKKLNYLASSTAPSYSLEGSFMRGTFVRVTLGEYLIDTPGFFANIGLSWKINYPWELNIEGANDVIIAPHVLDVSVDFTPIHDTLPQVGSPFIANRNVLDRTA